MWRLSLVGAGLLVVGLLLGNVAPSAAQVYCPAGTQGWRPVAYEVLTVDNLTVQRLDLSALPPSATNLAMALISVEDATVRFTFAGAERLSADNGHELAPGERFFLCGRVMLEQFSVIRTSQGSANARLRISLFHPF